MDRLDALRLFCRVAARGSFSAAAGDMKVKQSTASKWIAELELQLGASLFQRTTRSVQITDAGRRLLTRAGDVLAAFDDMTAEFAADNPEPTGSVRMSVPEVFGRRFVVPVVADFVLAHPRVRVELVFNDRYVNLVDEGFDLAVRVGVPVDTSARGRKLAESRRVLVASPDYVQRLGTPATPKALAQHQCLVHGQTAPSMVWRFRRGRGAETVVSVSGSVAANNSEAVLQLALRGLGVALLADWLVGDALRQGTLVALLTSYAVPPAPVYVLLPPGRFPSTTVRALSEQLAASVGEHIQTHQLG